MTTTTITTTTDNSESPVSYECMKW